MESNQNNPSEHIPKLIQDRQDYGNAYSPKNLLYVTDPSHNLLIYNTETGIKETKSLEAPEPLDFGTCMAQLQNGKLFCYGRYQGSGMTLLIDENFSVQILPSGRPCRWPSAIDFNNNVYCFGGKDENDYRLTFSRRFDLDENRWIDLAPMPQAGFFCQTVIFNGNILISAASNKNLVLYRIDIDSFSIIPYDFAKNKRKILISAERKLYLIECQRRSIYESEIESCTIWRRIGDSTIDLSPFQAYLSYNERDIFIGCINFGSIASYFKFNLDEKNLIKLE